MLAILAESALRSLLVGSVVWAGLSLLRVRNPHVHMTSWLMVLLASLSMPLLMHWIRLTIAVQPASEPMPAPEMLWHNNAPPLQPMQPLLPSEFGAAAVLRETTSTFDWQLLATAVYALVAGMLLLRLAVGLYLTWRMAQAAQPILEPWTVAADVRVSQVISGPVTFGSTILLPPQYLEWDLPKRQAVLAHEGAHVSHGDFYVLLLAAVNRAVFWFSPLVWWQLVRLAELAEIISDARALEIVEDKLFYAEILLDLVQHVRQAPAGLEMARASTVRTRVELILDDKTAPARFGWQERIWTAAAIAPFVIVAAVSIAHDIPTASRPVIDSAHLTTATAGSPQAIDFYSVNPNSIFALSREGGDLFGQLTWQRKLRLSPGPDGTYSYAGAAGPVTFAIGDGQPAELMLRQNDSDLRAIRIAAISNRDVEADGRLLDSYVGWYALSPNSVLNVMRDGGRIYVQQTGQPKFQVTAIAADAFSGGDDDVLVFVRDGQARVNQVLLQEPMSGARLAPRLAEGKARLIEEEFARRIAEAPERFRVQAPLPGSREMVLRGISDLQRGALNFDYMSAGLAAKAHRQAPELIGMLKSLGAVESIYFRGVAPGGYDVYGLKFANGFAEVRLLIGADGKADDVIFRPDGNEAPGKLVSCADEQGLRAQGDATPIRMFLFNSSGGDIQLYRLDSEGKRAAQGMVGDNMSSAITTSVGIPWVVTDGSGKCLEILLPGQRTRFHSVEGPRAASQPDPLVSRRSSPVAGSEAMLRQYIEGLARGEPNYERMTAEVAQQTRSQLPFNHAIFNRLGALRAVSFRGVNDFGNDIYIAHFANGTAEMRIGLVKDGLIGKIVLGP